MCDDIDATVATLRDKGVEFDGDITERGFGRATSIILPTVDDWPFTNRATPPRPKLTTADAQDLEVDEASSAGGSVAVVCVAAC